MTDNPRQNFENACDRAIGACDDMQTQLVYIMRDIRRKETRDFWLTILAIPLGVVALVLISIGFIDAV